MSDDTIIILFLLLVTLVTFGLLMSWSLIQKRISKWHWSLRHLFNATLCSIFVAPGVVGSVGGETGFALPVPIWLAALVQDRGWIKCVLEPFLFWLLVGYIIFFLRECLKRYQKSKAEKSGI